MLRGNNPRRQKLVDFDSSAGGASFNPTVRGNRNGINRSTSARTVARARTVNSATAGRRANWLASWLANWFANRLALRHAAAGVLLTAATIAAVMTTAVTATAIASARVTTAVAVATVLAVMTATVATAAVNLTAATTTAMTTKQSGRSLVFTANKGDADEREKHRSSENDDTIHLESSKCLNRYRKPKKS